MTGENSHLARRWNAFARTPFMFLLRLFLGRIFYAGDDAGAQELGFGVGAVLLLSAMPGLLVSLLMFEKYGSLIRFLRGDGAYDPFSSTAPDEYFFIVLSTVITGSITLWRWDSIFLDRRDHANLVPLPVTLRTIFLANLSAVIVVAALFAVVVNAASFILFPVAVAGSRASLAVFLRFSAGHAVAVVFASVFSFSAVSAIAGLLMAVLPASAFRRASLFVRFVLGAGLLALLASVFTIFDLLKSMPASSARRIALLPPLSILGVARYVWIGRNDAVAATISRAALLTFAATVFVGVLAYAISFRRSFLRIPETSDAGPLPRMRSSFSPLAPLHKFILRDPTRRACYHFIAKTLLRSDAHLQVLSAFAALGLVAAVEIISTIHTDRLFFTRGYPSSDFLSLPFLLAFCVIVGARFAFEIPSNLEANWLFRLWLAQDDRQPRSVARRVLLAFSLPWLAPATFAVTTSLFGWLAGTLHTAIFIVSTILAVEFLLIHFRKLPFTCSYPNFQSHSGLILVAYLFAFFLFTSYLPDLESWSLASPIRTVVFLPIFAIAFAAIRAYRSQILDMDKQLIFEEVSPSAF